MTMFAGSGDEGRSADGQGTAGSFDAPAGLAIDGDKNIVIANPSNHRIRMVSSSGYVRTFARRGDVGSQNGPPVMIDFKTVLLHWQSTATEASWWPMERTM